jgi:outer membrane receptor for ferrienterochelin and colicins
MRLIRIVGVWMLLIASTASLLAQHVVEGVVMEESANGEFTPLEFVHVVGFESQSGSYTDSTGYFKLELPGREEEEYHQDVIVVTYVGYAADTIHVNDQHYLSIVLKDNAVLDEVEVVYRKRTTEVSFLDPRLVQNISQGELFKAACCNLSESFETNASVDVNFTDAITGAKELQMLGLAGKYTMITREFMPGIRGIAVPYGLLYTPGSWIESMQVTKGAGSVVNGYESIAGQINVEWKKPEGDERLFVNAYVNEALRNEVNANASFDVSSKLQTAVLGHFSHYPKAFDRNNDGFADQPIGSLYVISNRWKYNNGNECMIDSLSLQSDTVVVANDCNAIRFYENRIYEDSFSFYIRKKKIFIYLILK